MGRDITKENIGGHVTELIPDYIDGVLSAGDKELVRLHIEGCADCRADFVELKATQSLLRTMPTQAPPRPFTLTREMVGVADRAPQKRTFWERVLAPAFAPRLATGSVVAFALLVMLFVSDATFLRNSSPLNVAMVSQAPQASLPANAPNAKVAVNATVVTEMATGDTANTKMMAETPTEYDAMNGSGGMSAAVAAPTGTTAMMEMAEATATTGTAASTDMASVAQATTPPISASGNSSPTTIAMGSEVMPFVVTEPITYSERVEPPQSAYDATSNTSVPASAAQPTITASLEWALAIVGVLLAAGAVAARLAVRAG